MELGEKALGTSWGWGRLQSIFLKAARFLVCLQHPDWLLPLLPSIT